MNKVTEEQIIDVKSIRENMYTDLFYKKVESMVYKAFDGLSDDNILEIGCKNFFDKCIDYITFDTI